MGAARLDLCFSLRQGAFTFDIDEHVEARVLALFGPSGSGKTTCLEAIAGIRAIEAGRVAVNGRPLADARAKLHVPARDRRVGYVPQDALLFPHMGVMANVLYGAARGGSLSGPDALALVEGAELANRRVDDLSGGERQRVALARALVSGPDLLLLDEPLASVDLPRRRRILEALVRVRDELRLPAVYVTHDPAEVRAVADAVLVLDGGRVVGRGIDAIGTDRDQ